MIEHFYFYKKITNIIVSSIEILKYDDFLKFQYVFTNSGNLCDSNNIENDSEKWNSLRYLKVLVFYNIIQILFLKKKKESKT